ncbi:Putative chromosome-partitioning protein parB [Candidatus Glomeribacter gigasporarum BEG34]|uniref:Putative chromosome-partitioning protein parB n=1 Tax=Candidatus Glomeribacter gigasporarum BEG34 TaxID=1070319 RepID=G2J996_9BURK|nr:ParB/RepB/Spo0J family partition protein [Candidatus Glomeribacter gigasporarum]CCD29343.1 Putative chromosome-partitioning protein parB [Candidatus Glomeribacter gigasporarum BEG34]
MNSSKFFNRLEAPAEQIVHLDIHRIEPDPNQPRTQFYPVDGVIDPTVMQALEELADDIDANSLLQPIIVQEAGDKYRIVVGERRWRAFKLNHERGRPNSSAIPAIVRPDLSAARLRLAQLSENLQRSDLTDLEVAQFIQSVLKQYPELQKQELARVLKKSNQYISRLLALLNPAWSDVVNTGMIAHASLLESFRALPEHKREELKARARQEDRPLTISDLRSAKEAWMQDPNNAIHTRLTPELAHQTQAFIASEAPRDESYTPSAALQSVAPVIQDTGGEAIIPYSPKAINPAVFEKRETRLTLQQLEALLTRNALPNKKHPVSLMLPAEEIKHAITQLGGTPSEDERQLPMVLAETINRLSR